MSKPRILVTVLCGPERYQWWAPNLGIRLLEAATLRDAHVRVGNVFGAYGYDLARNRAVETLMHSNADWVCMIDNDTVPPPDFVARVMKFARSRPGVDVVSLPSWIMPVPGLALLNTGYRNPPPTTSANRYRFTNQLPSEWMEVDVTGGGCLFIRREVLTALEQPCFHLPDYAIRDHCENGACEDFAFSDSVKAAGFHIWTHGGMACSHLKTVDLADMAGAKGAAL